MDMLLQLINSGACGLITTALAWMVLSPKVHDGVVIKAGLICMALGFGSIALLLGGGITEKEIVGLERSLLLINAGIAVVIVGYLLRKARAHHPVRRSTDWTDLPELYSHDHR